MTTILGKTDKLSGKGAHHQLRCREYGKSRPFTVDTLPDKFRRKLNHEFSDVIRYVRDLKAAVESRAWSNIENAITDLMKVLVDHTNVSDVPTTNKRQMRHLFVAYGGMDYLLQIFLPPISPVDARNVTKTSFRDKSETWNEILIIVRELLVTIPSLPDRYFSLDHIKYIFTLLHHTSVFESGVSAIEEILACREDPFPLYIVPNFFGLLKGFSSRHLAHFCRIVSLTIFEPEDRHILEGTQVLRSVDLLRIRRTRMFRSSNFVVEKNQNMLVQMTDFLPRLIQILRVINHGPELSEFIRRNIIAQLPISTDVLNFSATLAGIDDWEQFRRLDKAIQDSELEDLESQTRRSTSSSSTTRTASSSSATSPSAVMTELLDAVTPTAPSGALEIGNLIRVMVLAERLGIAEISPLGQAFLFTQQVPDSAQDSLAELQQRLLRNRLRRGYGASSNTEITPDRARNELLFHALILAPHQIEIIFVICTLLSGRRKIFVQNWLLELGLDKILHQLFERMSWDAPPFSGPNTMEHIHGPQCECNPENAVRVQVLRLIHNYYDRDFMGNANKFAILSPEEKEFFLRAPGALAEDGEGLHTSNLKLAKKGLFSRIIEVLDKQSHDSQYRFWLSACIENFLRGCGRRGQVFVTERGVLLSTIKNIFDVDPQMRNHENTSKNTLMNNTDNANGDFDQSNAKNDDVVASTDAVANANNSYQTSFDLVGEIIKCNPRVLEMLEAELSDEEFRAWIRVCLDHLVDSNVFLRSLFLTIEMYHMAVTHEYGGHSFEHLGFVENALTANHGDLPRNEACFGYLSASWTQEIPLVSEAAMQQYRDKKDLQERRAKAAKAAKTSSNSVKVRNSSTSSVSGTAAARASVTTTTSSRAAPRTPTSSTTSTTTTTTTTTANNQASAAATAASTASPAQQFLQSIVTNGATALSGLVTSFTSGATSSSTPSTSTSSSTTATITPTPQAKSKAIWDEAEIPVVYDHITASSSSLKLDINNHHHQTALQLQQQQQQQDLLNDGAFYTPAEGPYLSRASKTPALAEDMEFPYSAGTASEKGGVLKMDKVNAALASLSLDSSPPTSRSTAAGPASERSDGTANTKPAAEDKSPASVFFSGTSSAATVTVLTTELMPVEDDQSCFCTPNASAFAGPNHTLRNSNNSSGQNGNGQKSAQPNEQDFFPSTAEIIDMETKPQQNAVKTPSKTAAAKPASSLTIQPKIFRFSMFLIQEKHSILLRLMSTVSIYSINHENICCLNSALLILLFDLQRHQLGHTLDKLRSLAEEFDPVIPALVAQRKAQQRRRHKSSSIIPMLCVHLLSDNQTTTSTAAASSFSASSSSNDTSNAAVYGNNAGCGCSVPGCIAFSSDRNNLSKNVTSDSTLNGHTNSSSSSSSKKKSGATAYAAEPAYKTNLKRLAEDQAILAYQRVARQMHPSSSSSFGSPENNTSTSKKNIRNSYTAARNDDAKEERGEPVLLSNGDLVMMNFRELLWYWREYYLRRGRDRLSIEFSSHVSFQHFLDLVNVLCADDGGEYALLSAPMTLPESPYELTNLQCLLESRSLVRASVIHL